MSPLPARGRINSRSGEAAVRPEGGEQKDPGGLWPPSSTTKKTRPVPEHGQAPRTHRWVWSEPPSPEGAGRRRVHGEGPQGFVCLLCGGSTEPSFYTNSGPTVLLADPRRNALSHQRVDNKLHPGPGSSLTGFDSRGAETQPRRTTSLPAPPRPHPSTAPLCSAPGPRGGCGGARGELAMPADLFSTLFTGLLPSCSRHEGYCGVPLKTGGRGEKAFATDAEP